MSCFSHTAKQIANCADRVLNEFLSLNILCQLEEFVCLISYLFSTKSYWIRFIIQNCRKTLRNSDISYCLHFKSTLKNMMHLYICLKSFTATIKYFLLHLILCYLLVSEDLIYAFKLCVLNKYSEIIPFYIWIVPNGFYY